MEEDDLIWWFVVPAFALALMFVAWGSDRLKRSLRRAKRRRNGNLRHRV